MELPDTPRKLTNHRKLPDGYRREKSLSDRPARFLSQSLPLVPDIYGAPGTELNCVGSIKPIHQETQDETSSSSSIRSALCFFRGAFGSACPGLLTTKVPWNESCWSGLCRVIFDALMADLKEEYCAAL